MELIIKWGDNVNADIVKNVRGAYKHGDVIEVVEDGETANKPWLTVLVVPGILASKAKKLMQSSYFLMPSQVKITEAEYQIVKDLSHTIMINDVQHTVYMGSYFDPVAQGIDANGLRVFDIKILCPLHRRRFTIPSNLMTTLFPSGPGRRQITKTQFLNNLDNLTDKFGGVSLQETAWYSAFKANL